eukprot:jgi/Botrbrau1/23265/Bobra.0102s0010.1
MCITSPKSRHRRQKARTLWLVTSCTWVNGNKLISIYLSLFQLKLVSDCNPLDATLSVIDRGDGTCAVFEGNNLNVRLGNCTSNVFGGTNCTVLGADVYIFAANVQNLDASQYVTPDFQKYFAAIGIGNIIALSSFNLEPPSFLGFSSPPTGTVLNIADTFPNLLYATGDGMFVSGQPQGPLSYSFNGFPRNMVYVRDSIIVSYLSTSDLSFLSNVVCAPATLIIGQRGNTQLTSLSGLKVWPEGLLQYIGVMNSPLLLQQGFQPLGALLQCEAGTSPQTISTVRVNPVECNQLLTDLTQLCTYINFGMCMGAFNG